MRGDEIRERLRRENPWWDGAAEDGDPLAWVRTDPTLGLRAECDLGYRSGLLDDVATGPVDGRLIVVQGPPQVGKSVLLKDTVAALCARPDVDPRRLIYLPAGDVRPADLGPAIMLGHDLTRAAGDVPRVWFLDGVTGVRGWVEAVEHLRARTQLGVDTVVCTGPSGNGPSRLLHPMSFRQVLVATGATVPLPRPVRPWALQGTGVRVAAKRLGPFVDQLDLAWQAYLASGGFPRAVAEHHRRGEVTPAFLHHLAAGLHRDVDPGAGEGSVPRLLAELERLCHWPLNRTRLAADLAYSDRTALDSRLARLVDALVGLWSHQLDRGGVPVPRTQSKLYLTDPLLARLGSPLPSPPAASELARLTEACVGATLARAIDAGSPGRWLASNSIGFVTTGSRNEIDFAPVPVRGRSMSVPVEARWATTDWRTDGKIIEGRFLAGIVATRSTIDLTHPTWALPAPLLALLLQ